MSVMNMLVFLLAMCCLSQVSRAAAPQSPIVLFIIADDASLHFGESNHCDWVHTPNIDRLANLFARCQLASRRFTRHRIHSGGSRDSALLENTET